MRFRLPRRDSRSYINFWRRLDLDQAHTEKNTSVPPSIWQYHQQKNIGISRFLGMVEFKAHQEAKHRGESQKTERNNKTSQAHTALSVLEYAFVLNTGGTSIIAQKFNSCWFWLVFEICQNKNLLDVFGCHSCRKCHGLVYIDLLSIWPAPKQQTHRQIFAAAANLGDRGRPDAHILFALRFVSGLYTLAWLEHLRRNSWNHTE